MALAWRSSVTSALQSPSTLLPPHAPRHLTPQPTRSPPTQPPPLSAPSRPRSPTPPQGVGQGSGVASLGSEDSRPGSETEGLGPRS
eukprot:2503099-Rhodomonas_salina.5